jgi:hypothetical protein
VLFGDVHKGVPVEDINLADGAQWLIKRRIDAAMRAVLKIKLSEGKMLKYHDTTLQYT